MNSVNEWVKSSYTTAQNPNCVECRTDGYYVRVRDTKNRALGSLEFPVREWSAFLGDIDSI